MVNVSICDDDAAARAYLSASVRRLCPGCAVREYPSGELLLQSETPGDILLMDIRLDGIDGVQAARQLRDRTGPRHPVLIFITALEEYVFKAFDLGAFHYLLKPIDEGKFGEVFLNAVQQCECGGDRQLFINTRSLHRVISLGQVYYIESSRRKVIICTGEEKIEAYATMDEIQQALDCRFFRCHRGYFVNMAMISEYDRSSVRLKNGVELLLSKQKYNDFVQAYMQYLRDWGVWGV